MAGCVRKCLCLRPLLALLVGCFCLFLPGCGAKLPDSGTLPSVTVPKDTSYYLEVSTEEVQKKGLPVDGLTAAIKEELQRKSIMRPADSADARALVVKLEVREMFRAGTVSSGRPDWPFDSDVVRRATKAGPLIGPALGSGLIISIRFKKK